MIKKIIPFLTVTILGAGILSACNKTDTSGVSPVTMPDASQMEAQTPVIEDEKATDPSAGAEAENPGNINDLSEPEPAMTEEPAGTEAPASEIADKKSDSPFSENQYAEILDKYKTALKEGWDEDKLTENGLSYMLRYAENQEDKDAIGYRLLDINADGTDELFIGKQPEGKYQDTIYQMYTLRDGKPVLVFDGGERDCYYLCSDNATIYREGSGSAFDGFFFSYIFDDDTGKLKMVEGLLFDERANEKNPWFFVQTDDFDASKGQPITEEQFNKAEEAFENNKSLLNYDLFKSYNGNTEASVKDGKKDETTGKSANVYTNDELCKMAQDYYEKHNNFRPPIAEAEDNGDGRILIHLYEQMPDHTATSAWYVIDPKTGKGEDMIFEGEKIDLTEVAK